MYIYLIRPAENHVPHEQYMVISKITKKILKHFFKPIVSTPSIIYFKHIFF